MENQIHLTQSRKILLLQRQLGNAGSLTSAITPYHVAGVGFVAAARSLESLHLGQSPVVKASGNCSDDDKAIQVKPNLELAWHYRGMALYLLHRHSEAIASYDRAIQIKPDFAEAWTHRGGVLLALQSFFAQRDSLIN